ncbi:phenylacetic acid degradation bifunctional protein PaaZ [Auritidibacter ignavus]|uniref:phenylacetic acid degradation bifunctional protein PaaZ n=1 Tax=Auritidibacter ignavus TaxID=678932 RepID=UPI002FE544EB
MTDILTSYVLGAWAEPSAEILTENDSAVRTVHDPATGAELAKVSSAGLNFPTIVDYARNTGGPALRELTFHQRGVMLKKLGAYLNERRDRYHKLSLTTGATARDGLIDIDGGISTLFSYSSVARRQMPNSTTYLDGGVERLSKGQTFVGQHICTSRRGVSVQINAFNFPVWGMLEKFGPMFIAGQPVIVKPATSGSHLTHAVVRDIIASGLLPEGALQLICGSIGDLLDHLTEQDTVAFTGSAATAHSLAAHPCVQKRGTRFFAEADSLNFSLLGPDVEPGTEEFNLYVKELVTEMTAKSGQKCTAIRRALVPEKLLNAVADAVSEALAEVIVGSPHDETTEMGPLVSTKQADDVRAAIAKITSAGAEVVCGYNPSRPKGANELSAAFVEPTLLKAHAEIAAVHEVEAFGPVATLLPYSSLADAIETVTRGRGSLVGSLISHDPVVVRDVLVSTAPWHGRILVLDRDNARESTGHGAPLPTLVHGGPGRAGGGEELGGIRSVLHYMQRTAVQASPDMLTAITGTWVPEATRHTEGTHPFAKDLSELRIGDTIVGGPRKVTLEDIDCFAEFTGDTFYAHTDEDAAAANPFFPGRVAHGYLVVSFAAGLFVKPEPGPVLANYGLENLRFITPVSPGDELTVTLTAKQITPRETDAYGEVRWDALVTNQDAAVVATYDVLTLVEKDTRKSEA